MNDIVRKNLKAFREEVGMTTDQVAQLSGVPVDNLRRYEGGGSGVPADVLHRLGAIYGHSMDDFFMDLPPKADQASRPMFHLRTLPGVEVDEKKYQELTEIINKVNTEIRARRGKKPTSK